MEPSEKLGVFAPKKRRRETRCGDRRTPGRGLPRHTPRPAAKRAQHGPGSPGPFISVQCWLVPANLRPMLGPVARTSRPSPRRIYKENLRNKKENAKRAVPARPAGLRARPRYGPSQLALSGRDRNGPDTVGFFLARSVTLLASYYIAFAKKKKLLYCPAPSPQRIF